MPRTPAARKRWLTSDGYGNEGNKGLFGTIVAFGTMPGRPSVLESSIPVGDDGSTRLLYSQ